MLVTLLMVLCAHASDPVQTDPPAPTPSEVPDARLPDEEEVYSVVPGIEISPRVGVTTLTQGVPEGGCSFVVHGLNRADGESVTFDAFVSASDPKSSGGVGAGRRFEQTKIINKGAAVFRGAVGYAPSPSHPYADLLLGLIRKGSVSVQLTLDGEDQPAFVVKKTGNDPSECIVTVIDQVLPAGAASP